MPRRQHDRVQSFGQLRPIRQQADKRLNVALEQEMAIAFAGPTTIDHQGRWGRVVIVRRPFRVFFFCTLPSVTFGVELRLICRIVVSDYNSFT